MASTREIRRRIRSVKNIAKVTKAMETVAAAKMRKAQQQVLATRPYAEKSWEVLTYLARLRASAAAEQPLLQQRPVAKIGLLLITADRGLAGAYNSNIIRKAALQIREWEKVEAKQVSVVTIGRKGRDWMLRHGPPLRAEFTGLGDRPTSNDVAPVASVVIEDFVSGIYDAVYVAFTDFHTTLNQEPIIRQAAAHRAGAARSADGSRLHFRAGSADDPGRNPARPDRATDFAGHLRIHRQRAVGPHGRHA